MVCAQALRPGTPAYNNHLKNFGHPSETGYKDVLRAWNPDKLDPAKLVQIYKDAGARFLIIQGVHHDEFDLWNSRYQPWNAAKLGPKRDLLGEWTKAARAAGMHYGVSFHTNTPGVVADRLRQRQGWPQGRRPV